MEVQRFPVTFEFTSPEVYLGYRRELSSRYTAALGGRSGKDQRAVEQAVVRALEAYRAPGDGIRMKNWAYCIGASREFR